MDQGYDALEAAASAYPKSHHEDDGRGHRSHRDRDYDRDDRDRRYRREERDERPRYDDRDRHRDRGDHRERDGGGRDHRYDDRRRDYDRGPPRRREDDGGYAEPMGGYRDRPPRPPRREEDQPFAQPMRQYSPPRTYNGGGGGPPGGYGGPRDGGHGGDRGRGRQPGGGGGGRGRGQTPPREPTPPGTVPLKERKVKNSLWDIRPVQFAGIGAMAAKMTGMFTYGPGRCPPPPELGIPQALIAGSFPPSGQAGQRQAKRIYVGGIEESMTEQYLLEFFNKTMHERGLVSEAEGPGDPIQGVQVHAEKQFAFLEFRSIEEAASALSLDNIMCDETPLRVRRPKDYSGLDPLQQFMGGGGGMSDSPNRLFIGGLPTQLEDSQVLELLKSFGELKSFNLVKESNAEGSKGFAFAEYIDTETTNLAIQGLNGFQLGDRTLIVQRAAVGKNSSATPLMPGQEGYLATSAIFKPVDPEAVPVSRVMLLLNMVTADELYDDEEYQEIVEDIQSECAKYGEVEGVRVPRPVPKSKKWEPSDSAVVTAEKARRADLESGVGRVYVMYRDVDSTKKAMEALGGRQFGGRTIVVANVPEEDFLGPAPPPPPPPEEPKPEDLDAAAANALGDILG